MPPAAAGEAQFAITVEYHRPGGANPGDVHCTALLEGTVGAGTTLSIHSVPSYTPVFSLCGFRLRWKVCVRPAVDLVLGSAHAEPEPEEGGPVECDASLEVFGGPGLCVNNNGVGVRGLPSVDRIALGRGAVWDRRGRQRDSTASQFFAGQIGTWTDMGGGWVSPQTPNR